MDDPTIHPPFFLVIVLKLVNVFLDTFAFDSSFLRRVVLKLPSLNSLRASLESSKFSLASVRMRRLNRFSLLERLVNSMDVFIIEFGKWEQIYNTKSIGQPIISEITDLIDRHATKLVTCRIATLLVFLVPVNHLLAFDVLHLAGKVLLLCFNAD